MAQLPVPSDALVVFGVTGDLAVVGHSEQPVFVQLEAMLNGAVAKGDVVCL